MSTIDLMNSVLQRLDGPRREAFDRLISRYPELADRITHLVSDYGQRLEFGREDSGSRVRFTRSTPASHVAPEPFRPLRPEVQDDRRPSSVC